MAIENTTDFNTDVSGETHNENAADPGDTISADTFNSMLDVLEDLAGHNHIFYDDYTTVCECQCQCACSRGTL
jgi:hypothetical protein